MTLFKVSVKQCLLLRRPVMLHFSIMNYMRSDLTVREVDAEQIVM